MSAAYLRRAGVQTLPGGRHLTWSVAEGIRGRRWRGAVTGADGELAEVLAVETGPSGALTRLEMTTAAGLLTLHPAGSPVRLHGNIVRAGGVEPVSHLLVLAELDLPLQRRDGNFDTHNIAQHVVDVLRFGIPHLPGPGLGRLVSSCQQCNNASHIALVIMHSDRAVRMHHFVVPGRNLGVRLMLAGIPVR